MSVFLFSLFLSFFLCLPYTFFPSSMPSNPPYLLLFLNLFLLFSPLYPPWPLLCVFPEPSPLHSFLPILPIYLYVLILFSFPFFLSQYTFSVSPPFFPYLCVCLCLLPSSLRLFFSTLFIYEFLNVAVLPSFSQYTYLSLHPSFSTCVSLTSLFSLHLSLSFV